MPLSDLSNPEVLLRENWAASRRLGIDGTPLLPPAFVAEVGARVWLVDIRDDDELTGPLGHIPGVWRIPLADVSEVPRRLPARTPTVIICDDGTRSSTAARYLVSLGMTTVAAMAGGMIGWRGRGFGVSRDPGILSHTLEAPKPGFGADGRLLSRASGGPLTAAMLQEHVGDPAKVRRVKLAALMVASHTSCVDGREDRAIVGTPGGDAGEFLLGLAAVEKHTGTPVPLGEVPRLLRAFADTFGGVYLHTDNGALNRLTRSLANDDRLRDTVGSLRTIDDWEEFLRRPPASIQSALLEHLLDPPHIGCGHIKLALTKSDEYEIRPELITAFFGAFYAGLWSGAPDLVWVVLGGDHAERGVVNVFVEGDLSAFAAIPVIAPSIGGAQVFVNHPQVVAYLRKQTAHFLTAQLPDLPTVDELASTINGLGDQQAGETLQALAKGLPVFAVYFNRSGSVTVEPAGTV